MARVEVPMPQMGESIAEGTVSQWLKQIGDTVERDEPILEISTDKVDAEIPAQSAGIVVEVLVMEGETVEVGTILALIDSEGTGPVESKPEDTRRDLPPHFSISASPLGSSTFTIAIRPRARLLLSTSENRSDFASKYESKDL